MERRCRRSLATRLAAYSIYMKIPLEEQPEIAPTSDATLLFMPSRCHAQGHMRKKVRERAATSRDSIKVIVWFSFDEIVLRFRCSSSSAHMKLSLITMPLNARSKRPFDEMFLVFIRGHAALWREASPAFNLRLVADFENFNIISL